MESFPEERHGVRAMKYYPVLMDVRDRACLVVGGGAVGTRKALGLARAGARVRVVSPEVSPKLVDAAKKTDPAIELIKRPFQPSDLGGVSLAFAATNHSDINARVRQAAVRANVLCNAAEGEDKGDFILPSVVAREDLIIAVSTSGASPALAKRIRVQLEQAYGPEYGELAGLLAQVRRHLLDRGHDPAGHKQLLTDLVARDLAPLIARRDIPTINEIVTQVLGEEFSWEGLTA